MKTRQLSIRLDVFASLILDLMAGNAESASTFSPAEAMTVIRQGCSGYSGAEPCYISLAD